MDIFLDFDNVIFDTRKFKRSLMRAFRDGGVSARDFTRTYEEAKNGRPYSPARHLQLLAREGCVADMRRVKTSVIRATTDTSPFVFRDAHAFFARHGKKDLRLLSFGDPAFQKKKISGSGIKKYFSAVIVTKGDKGKEIEKVMRTRVKTRQSAVVLIDDSDVHIREARRIPGVIALQLRRRRGIHKSPSADYHVSTLAHASRIIASL